MTELLDRIDLSLTRRGFLAGTGAVVASTAFGPTLAFASPADPSQGDVIVLLFLRGGADGLSFAAPWQMPSYQALRPTIRVKDASEFTDPTSRAGLPLVAGGAVGSFPLSGTFALHPGMARLHETAWTAGDLAIVHAVGMPASESDTRSHFDSMRNWESGSASLDVNTGFLNRFLASVGAVDRLPAVGRGSNLQRSLAGPVAAYSMNDLSSFGVSGFSSNTRARTALTQWYEAGPGDLLGTTGANTLGAIGTVAGINWSDARFAPQNGATYGSDDIGRNFSEIGKLIRADLGLRVACLDAGGWDTHDGMGAPEDTNGYFRQRSGQLADALAAFYTDMGSAMSEVTVVTVSEFGRTINENGSGGVDHGRGSAMFVMGGGVRGGVHGDFVTEITDGPEGDLAVVNDYRRVLGEVLSTRGGAASAASIFPTWTPQAPLGVCS